MILQHLGKNFQSESKGTLDTFIHVMINMLAKLIFGIRLWL